MPHVHNRIDLDEYEAAQPKTTPTDETRRLLAEHQDLYGNPGWGPERIVAHQDALGHLVTVEQVRGFLAGM